MTVTQYNIDRQTYGVNGWSQQFPSTIQTVTLAVSTDATVTCPGTAATGVPSAHTYNKFIARIRVTNSTKTVWFALNATAQIPQGANVFAASTSEGLSQGVEYAYLIKSGDVLHFLSAAAADISVAFFAFQSG